MKHPLFVTMGDPAGIGPEVVARAFLHQDIFSCGVPVVIGDASCLQEAIRRTGVPLTVQSLSTVQDVQNQPGQIPCLDMKLLSPADFTMGQVSPQCGHAAYQYIQRAIQLTMQGAGQAVVTAPINKEALQLAGYQYCGHTEIFAQLAGTKHYAMLLACGKLRVIHCTTHVSMREACDLITQQRVVQVIRLGQKALRQMGVDQPRIAVAGLNPHASEHGLFGTEEERAIIPAIAQARAEGVIVDGPVPADTVFVKALGGMYDLVVAMYHDQGHIPLKLAGFHMDDNGRFSQLSGVNMTVGLPFPRTSVDHGTAFDRANQYCANEQSMVEAIVLAGEMVRQRRMRP